MTHHNTSTQQLILLLFETTARGSYSSITKKTTIGFFLLEMAVDTDTSSKHTLLTTKVTEAQTYQTTFPSQHILMDEYSSSPYIIIEQGEPRQPDDTTCHTIQAQVIP